VYFFYIIPTYTGEKQLKTSSEILYHVLNYVEKVIYFEELQIIQQVKLLRKLFGHSIIVSHMSIMLDTIHCTKYTSQRKYFGVYSIGRIFTASLVIDYFTVNVLLYYLKFAAYLLHFIAIVLTVTVLADYLQSKSEISPCSISR
jgi:hypothetical protein